MPWWKFWDPDKAPGKGSAKNVGKGSGRVADSATYKKSAVPKGRRKYDGRANGK